jgi:hypothetical protein
MATQIAVGIVIAVVAIVALKYVLALGLLVVEYFEDRAFERKQSGR